MIKVLKRIWNTLLNVILFIEFCLIIIFTLPNLFNIKPFVVTSGSMKSIYPVGSLIYVKKVSPSSVKVGDSITFYLNDSIVATHQVYEINKKEGYFKTRGVDNKDANGKIINDAKPVYFSNFIGTPIYCVPVMGSINLFITKKPGLYVVLGITILLVFISFVFDKIKKD